MIGIGKTFESLILLSIPVRCGQIFDPLPILTPFGTCFTSHPNYTLTATSTGVTERLTLLLSTHSYIVKNANWLQDEALRSGVFYAVSRSLKYFSMTIIILIEIQRREHPVNSLFRGAKTLSPATNNLISMKQVRKDRTAFSREKSDIFIKESEICCNERDEYEANFRSIIPSSHQLGFPILMGR